MRIFRDIVVYMRLYTYETGAYISGHSGVDTSVYIYIYMKVMLPYGSCPKCHDGKCKYSSPTAVRAAALYAVVCPTREGD